METQICFSFLKRRLNFRKFFKMLEGANCFPPTFQSVYMKDYLGNPGTPLLKAEPSKDARSEDGNVIRGPFQRYIQIKDCRKKTGEPSEYVETVLDRFPKIKEFLFKDPIRHDFLCKDYERSLLSVYQADICRDGDIVQKGKRPNDLPYTELPKGWDRADTTYISSYRDPTMLNLGDTRGKRSPMHDNQFFTFSKKMQEIMKVRTGNSEYEGGIGDLGQYIIDHELYGQIPPV